MGFRWSKRLDILLVWHKRTTMFISRQRDKECLIIWSILVNCFDDQNINICKAMHKFIRHTEHENVLSKKHLLECEYLNLLVSCCITKGCMACSSVNNHTYLEITLSINTNTRCVQEIRWILWYLNNNHRPLNTGSER